MSTTKSVSTATAWFSTTPPYATRMGVFDPSSLFGASNISSDRKKSEHYDRRQEKQQQYRTDHSSTTSSPDQSTDGSLDTYDEKPHPMQRPISTKKANADQVDGESSTGGDWTIPISQFLAGFRVQAAASLSNAYRTHHPLNKSANTGIVTTSLAEDVFFLVDVQLNVLHDFLEDSGTLGNDAGEDVIEDALLAIFRCIWVEQTRHRNSFLTSFELCCATANDFFRMMTRMEDLMTVLELKYPFLEWNALDGDTKTEVIRREANDLATLFVSDAVYASQRSHIYVMKALKDSSTSRDLFHRDWEDRFTHNEVIISMIRVFEEYNNDLQNFLCNDYLYHKVVAALVKASVCFYVRLLLQKAFYIRKNANRPKLANKFTSEDERIRQRPFLCPTRALCRMMYDIRILQDYFQKISKDSNALMRVVADEMNTLTVIHEFLGLAVGNTGIDSVEEFIVVLHKRSGANSAVTKHFLSDLWMLAAPHHDQERISVTVGLLKSELDMVTARIKESAKKASPDCGSKKAEIREVVPRLEDMLKEYYEDRIWQDKVSGCGGLLSGKTG